MSKKYFIELIQMNDDALNVEIKHIAVKEFRAALKLALKEQDRDTRHACAESCMVTKENQNYIVHKAFHDLCMNCKGGMEEIWV